MDPLLAEFLPPGKPAPAPAVGRHLAYVAIPVILFGFDLLVTATSRAGGCAAMGEAIELFMANMAITFLTWVACGVDLASGRRSGWLGLGFFLNSAWMLPFAIHFLGIPL